MEKLTSPAYFCIREGSLGQEIRNLGWSLGGDLAITLGGADLTQIKTVYCNSYRQTAEACRYLTSPALLFQNAEVGTSWN